MYDDFSFCRIKEAQYQPMRNKFKYGPLSRPIRCHNSPTANENMLSPKKNFLTLFIFNAVLRDVDIFSE